jgi:hypothetical protein
MAVKTTLVYNEAVTATHKIEIWSEGVNAATGTALDALSQSKGQRPLKIIIEPDAQDAPFGGPPV